MNRLKINNKAVCSGCLNLLHHHGKVCKKHMGQILSEGSTNVTCKGFSLICKTCFKELDPDSTYYSWRGIVVCLKCFDKPITQDCEV